MSHVPFYSKHNQVYPVLRQGCAMVEKHFADLDDWRRERNLYAALANRLPLPRVLAEKPGLLVLEYKNHPTLLSELERQELDGFDAAPWQGLAVWLRQCLALCGQLPIDGNLRNFLWDRTADRIIGLDLEAYSPDSLDRCGARLIGFLLTYDPADTEIKRQAAKVLAGELSVSDELVQDARHALSAHRQEQEHKPMSGVILAGGASRRMGRNKAELVLSGKSLLQHQLDKLRALGIEDIMLSGAACPALPGTRVIPDEFPGMGPLAGLHTCLKAARNPACLVLSVDTPLVPASALAHLCRKHREGITVLRHGKWEEPLIAVYDCSAAMHIQALLEQGECCIQRLKGKVPWSCFHYLGPEDLLINCNRPEDLAAAEKLSIESCSWAL